MNLPDGPEAPEFDPPCEEPKQSEATSTRADVPNDEPDTQDPAQSSEVLAPATLVPGALVAGAEGASVVAPTPPLTGEPPLGTGSPPSDALP
ncbi:MAG: hypothetical protein K0Q80_2448, partial [Microvirga sp.]|nr:hypothetical protein [Microvirga sp.]